MPDKSQEVVDDIRRVAKETIQPLAASVDRAREFPKESLDALRNVGAFGLVVPEDKGGAGGTLKDLADGCEAVGSACASTSMAFLMHLVTSATVAGGGGESADGVLSELARGALSSLAFSERGTGAHFYAPELTVDRSNATPTVSGRKSFVTSGGHADHYLVLVQGRQEGTADAYLIPQTDCGVAFEGAWDGVGMAGNSSVVMQLADVPLPDERRVGEAGKGADLIFDVVAPYFLIGLAAVNVGIAGAAAAVATAHVAGRKYPDGSSLAEIQYIQHGVADMDRQTRAARHMVQDAARLADAGDADALVPVMEGKIHATETAVAVTQTALEVTGGQGYSGRLPIERHLRDARAGSIMAPTNAVLRNWVGKALTGLPVP